MDKSILRELWGNLIEVDRIGAVQTKELVFQQNNRTLKIYIYKELNYNRPHIHAYWKKDYIISIAINNTEVLAGSFPSKYLNPLNKWIRKYQSELIAAWEQIQSGIKPELLWVKNT